MNRRRNWNPWLATGALLGGATLLVAMRWAAATGAPPRPHPPDNAKRRAEWFMRGRHALDGRPPAEHYWKALRQRQNVPYIAVSPRRLRAGTRLPDAAPLPTSGSWTELGPNPQNDMGFVRVSGRVTALAVDLVNDPTGNTVYAGAAYGGVWVSTNGLTANPTWRPISDNTGSLAVGALALDTSTNPATVYVATGEQNNSIDSYYGVGILKGTPNGSGAWTWTLTSSADNGTHPLLGLAFAKILVDPTNPQVLLAAGGSSTNLSANNITNGYHRGIYRSADGGQSWKFVFTVSDSNSSNYSCTDLAYDPVNKVYYAAMRTHGIYKSADQGQTWAPVGASSPFVGGANVDMAKYFHRASLAFANGTLFALMTDINGFPSAPQPCSGGQTTGCDTGLTASKDGGNTWTPIAGPTCGSLPSGACVSSDPLFSNGAGDQGDYDMYLAVPPNTASALVVAGIDVWSTTNLTGMSTAWTDLTQAYGPGVVHPDQHAIAFVNAGTWYIGNDGGVWATTDSGGGAKAQGGAGDWANLNGDLGTIQLMSATPDPTRAGIYTGGSQDNGTVGNASAGGTLWGETWFGDGGFTAVDPDTPTRYFTENSDGGGKGNPILLRSDSAGVPTSISGATTACNWPQGDLSVCNPSYNVILDTNGISELGSFYLPYDLVPNDPAQIALGTCRLWIGPAEPASADQGWLAVSPDLSTHAEPMGFCGADYIQNLAVAPNSASTIYVVTTDGRVQRTTNAFAPTPTWADLTVGPLPTDHSLPFGAVAVSPTDADTAYVGIMGFVSGSGLGHVYTTSNGGTSWTNITGNLPDAPVNWIMVDPEAPTDVYVATDVGVFVITDGGAAGGAEIWQQLGTGLPNTTVFQLRMAAASRTVVAATHGRGAWAIAAVATPLPDFTLTSPASVQTVAANASSATFTIGARAQGGFSGAINLGCGSGATCAFSPAIISPGQTSTLTVSGLSGLSSDSVSVTVTGASAGLSHELKLAVAPATFSLNVSPSSTTVSAGQSATFTVNAAPLAGFSGTVSLTCLGAPRNGTCSFSSSSLNLSGGTAQSATLTVTTKSGGMAPFGDSSRPWGWAALAALLLVLLSLSARRRPQPRWVPAPGWLLPLLLAMLLVWAGCGGGSNPIPGVGPGVSPKGTYDVIVTGTSGGITRSEPVVLIVQ